jgi:hypothetical protein
VEQIRSLDADVVAGNPAHGKARICATLAQANHGALEHLNALAIALDDLLMHAHLIAGLQRWNVGIRL